jgi:hypothetical protein
VRSSVEGIEVGNFALPSAVCVSVTENVLKRHVPRTPLRQGTDGIHAHLTKWDVGRRDSGTFVTFFCVERSAPRPPLPWFA